MAMTSADSMRGNSSAESAASVSFSGVVSSSVTPGSAPNADVVRQSATTRANDLMSGPSRCAPRVWHGQRDCPLVAFGDSLSDDGNVYQLTQGYPNNPLLPFPSDQYYVGGRQSNGPVAVEYLSSALGVPLHNFAQAGATTGTLNVWDDGSLGAPAGTLGLSGMLAQVQSYVAQPGASDPNALYLLWGGPNDFVAGLANPATFDPVATISAAMTNLSNEAGLLFWDDAHPTTQAHSIFSREMAAAVPEPETWALLIAGLGLVGWRRRLLRGMPA